MFYRVQLAFGGPGLPRGGPLMICTFWGIASDSSARGGAMA